MSNRLDQVFNLPPTNVKENDISILREEVSQTKKQSLVVSNEINSDELDINRIEVLDNEISSLVKIATDRFTDIMELGFQSDEKFAGDILSSGASILSVISGLKKTQMEARFKKMKAKMDKQLADMKIQLDKNKLDIIEEDSNESDEKNTPVIIQDTAAVLEYILKVKQDAEDMKS